MLTILLIESDVGYSIVSKARILSNVGRVIIRKSKARATQWTILKDFDGVWDSGMVPSKAKG